MINAEERRQESSTDLEEIGKLVKRLIQEDAETGNICDLFTKLFHTYLFVLCKLYVSIEPYFVLLCAIPNDSLKI